MPSSEVARVLGVDVGEARIGLALSDPLRMFASPLEVIVRRQVEPLGRLVQLIAEYQVQQVVVGHPLRLSGEAGPACRQVEAFVATLGDATRCPIVLWDERLSTAQAERLLISQNVRRAARRAVIDKVAAAIILQSYLDATSR